MQLIVGRVHGSGFRGQEFSAESQSVAETSSKLEPQSLSVPSVSSCSNELNRRKQRDAEEIHIAARTLGLRCLFIAISLFVGSASATASHAAPVAKPDTKVEALKRQFTNPDVDYRIHFVTRMNDKVDPDELGWQIRSIKDQGCGGVFTYCERHGDAAPHKFLSDWWWQVVRWTAAACAKEGLEYWAYDEEDWPSGVAGGRILKEHPELGWKYLKSAERQFDGPATAAIDIGEGTLVAAVAFQSDGPTVRKDSIVDLSKQVTGRKLTWQVPQGRWTVAVYMAVMVKMPFPFRDYTDLMDRRTTAAILDLDYRGHAEQIRRTPGAKLLGFFLDEPPMSMANYNGGSVFTWYPSMPYTPELPKAFHKFFGEELWKHLPLLYHDGGPETVRFRCRYWETCRRLYSENYFGQIYRFCEERGLKSSGHLLTEEDFSTHLSLQGGNLPSHFRNLHIPGIDWIMPLEAPLPAVVPKYATSVAHLLDRDRTWCESFAGGSWGLTFQQMRGVVNWLHVNGINMQIPISYQYSLREPKRTAFFNPAISYQQPYWDHFRSFADCEARLCLLTAGGGHVAQIALAYPSVDMQAHCWDAALLTARGQQYNALGDMIRAAGYDFDVLDDQAIVDDSQVALGCLVTPTEKFPLLIVPQIDAARRETIARCLDLVKSGGTVIFIGHAPLDSFEDGGDDPKLARLILDLLGSPCAPPLGNKSRFWRSHGRGRAGFAPTIEDVIAMLREAATPDVTTPRDTKNFFAYHRRLDGGHLYLLFNRSDARRTVEITISVRGYAERWDPTSGRVEPLPASDTEITPQGTQLKLAFAPQELIPIVLRPNEKTAALGEPNGVSGQRPSKPPALLKEIPVPGPFHFRIEETMKRPHVAWNFSQQQDGWKSTAKPIVVPEIIPAGDWCGHGLATFSGLGHYETQFTLEELPQGSQIVVDLGRVGVSAEVRINGTSAGVVTMEPYRVDVTRHVRSGVNRIEIVVANTLANYFSQFKEVAGNPYSFGGVKPGQCVSGLLGPVTIRVLNAEPR